jgi:uncharacterized membrane protein YgcG
MMKRVTLLASIVTFLILLAPFYVSAQLRGEHVRSFETTAKINKDGTVDIKEIIVYDFNGLERHGIYRDIPYIKTNNEGKKFRMEIDSISVTDLEGNEHQFTRKEENGYLKLRIGNSNLTVTGLKTYIVSYRVSGALTYFSDHDELYWNMTGNSWEVPIAGAKAEVILPDPMPSGNITAACFTGYQGSSNSYCDLTVSEKEVAAVTKNILSSREGMTMVVGFPKNTVAVLEPKEVVGFFDTLFGKIILTLIIIISVIAAVAWYIIYPLWVPVKWYLTGRDPETREGMVTAWFEPPKTEAGRLLTPAETGALIDENVHLRDVSATIVHLAQRSYLKIVEKKKNDFYLTKTKEYAGDQSLLPFETHLLKGLFTKKDEIHLKDAELYGTVQEVEKMIYEQLVENKFFPHNPQSVRTFYTIMAGIAGVTFNLPLLFVSLVFGRHMPKKTLTGAKTANFAQSLKNFLGSQERQLEFQAKNQVFFEKLLPYAVAFGVEKIWANRFKDINMTPPDWYQGYDSHIAFTSGYLIGRLNSSFTSFRSSATPTRSSSGFSSGFSGGGFSGGGGGGGGGGSW